METKESFDDLLWAKQLTEIIGGLWEDPYGVNGIVAGYRTISRNGFRYRLLIMRLSLRDRGTLVQKLVGEIPGYVLEILKDKANYELSSDIDGHLLLLLQWDEDDPHYNSRTREFARALTIYLEQTYEVELRIGIGEACAACAYLPFSRASALQNITRYNVSRTIQSILTYVSLNYSDPELSIGRIARDNFLNYSYLCTEFKREVGITLSRYIQRFRMQTAAALLTLPNRTILEVARTVGYTDIKYFTRPFKQVYGLTPNQYRAQQRFARDSYLGVQDSG